MSKKPLSLYLHIPFCVSKCAYCDFLSAPGTPGEMSYYLRYLIKEINSYEPLNNLYYVSTIFIGGGTPSILDEEQIDELLSSVSRTFEVDENAEITIECNPKTVTEKKLIKYMSLGINRLSIGLQSADDNELKLLGRPHTYKDFEDTYYLARKVGFDNINVDIMSGIPSQKIESYTNTLRKVIELNPEHISSYSLQLEEGTPFYEKYTNPLNSSELPSEKLDRDMYKYTKTFLENAGYLRYEISNYARPGMECKHNVGYWKLSDYIGLGLGSASYFEGKRFTGPRDLDEYKEHARTAYDKLASYEPQSDKEKMEEFMFLGLRLMSGISINQFEEKFKTKFSEVYGGVTKVLFEKGLVSFNEDIMTLTDKGIDVSNMVLSNFLL